MLQEEGWWRLMIAAAVGLAVGLGIAVIRDPKGPVAIGGIAGVAVYVADWMTSKNRVHDE